MHSFTNFTNLNANSEFAQSTIDQFIIKQETYDHEECKDTYYTDNKTTQIENTDNGKLNAIQYEDFNYSHFILSPFQLKCNPYRVNDGDNGFKNCLIEQSNSNNSKKNNTKLQETPEETQKRRKVHTERVALRRSRMTLEELEIRRAKDAASKAIRRSKMSPQEAAIKRRKDAAAKALKRSQMTAQEIELRRKKDVEAKALKKLNLTPEEIQIKRNKCAAMQALRRSRMTPEEIQLRRIKDAAFQALRRSKMTPEEIAIKRKRNAAAKALRRSRMTQEEIMLRRMKDAAFKALKRSQMTAEEIVNKRKKDAAAKSLRRSNMTEVDLTKRREAEAAAKRLRKKSNQETCVRKHLNETDNKFELCNITQKQFNLEGDINLLRNKDSPQHGTVLRGNNIKQDSNYTCRKAFEDFNSNTNMYKKLHLTNDERPSSNSETIPEEIELNRIKEATSDALRCLYQGIRTTSCHSIRELTGPSYLHCSKKQFDMTHDEIIYQSLF